MVDASVPYINVSTFEHEFTPRLLLRRQLKRYELSFVDYFFFVFIVHACHYKDVRLKTELAKKSGATEVVPAPTGARA
jgi:hypothetical protein